MSAANAGNASSISAIKYSAGSRRERKLRKDVRTRTIQFLQKAKTAIEEKNLQERSKNIESARKIIRELMRTIDLENGNDVSKSLFRLYNRMATNLIKANVSRNIGLIDQVIEDLTNIRWGFQKAIEIQSGMATVEEVMQERSQLENKGAENAE